MSMLRTLLLNRSRHGERMSPAEERPRRGLSRLWAHLVTAQVLLCIGTGLVSIVMPEGSGLPQCYYDGDGDDAGATSERFADIDAFALSGRPTPLPILTRTLLGLAVAPVSQLNPRRSEPPLLRSPPA
jgi:hypothetical protein